ncbi:14783_t:CDS:2 [Funneliformis mosseae]|uniref:14783_t:CDS:1 n=1 Tax=Funneliformis mosseae TaxID=27381 RepID=A0A9N9AVF7_FUNMO|nr:14783_t:CDS:2 [Funneliformis mosseae]
MFKIYSILLPPFNKFAVFILYGLLSVALIALAQDTENEKEKGTTIFNGKVENCIVEPLEPVEEANKQKTIGYVQLFSTGLPKIPWNNYDYINVIAFPKDGDGKGYSIYYPNDENKLKPIDDLRESRTKAKATTKILLSIRNYNVDQWPQDDDANYQRIITDTIKTINDHGLDGIDIEYPGMRGSFLELVGKTLMLTVGRDVIGNLKEIDYFNIETYHNALYQNLKTPPAEVNYKSYPNSPLDVYKKAYEDWRNIGVDSKKIIMGVDFGNTFQMVPNKIIQQIQTVEFPKSTYDIKKLDIQNQIQQIRNFCPNDESNIYSWPWKYLPNIVLNSTDDFCTINTTNPKWTRKFDPTDNSGTPWLYKLVEPQFSFYLYVSYEDISSLRSKLEFAMTNSIGGMSISDVSHDDNKTTLSNFMQPIRGLSVPSSGSSSPSNGSGNGKSKSIPNDSAIPKKNKAGLIAGSVIGVIFGLALFGSCAYMYRQKILLKSEAGDIKTKGAHTTSKIEMASEQSPNRFGSPTTVLPVASGHVTAMFDFIGKEENDLSFKKGDVIEVLEKGDGPNDWWVGRVNGIVGEFPGNYVKET